MSYIRGPFDRAWGGLIPELTPEQKKDIEEGRKEAYAKAKLEAAKKDTNQLYRELLLVGFGRVENLGTSAADAADAYYQYITKETT